MGTSRDYAIRVQTKEKLDFSVSDFEFSKLVVRRRDSVKDCVRERVRKSKRENSWERERETKRFQVCKLLNFANHPSPL